MDTVPLSPVEGHTTYQLDRIPSAQAPWTYADKKADGSYARIGGGDLDPATGHWSQGAYNADDIARTAVVYLRHWQQTGDAASKERAFQTLRSLTYLQTTAGPNAGNVVLWQQADGTLTPSAKPVELPDPSDSAESYWLARTVWALGEGYAAFAGADPAFASFLQERLQLALGSLNKQSLAKYGTYDTADGVKVPAWLIAGGADASAEAVLGLAAYVKAAPGDGVATQALTRLGEGVAAMSSGSGTEWPFGAILPWNKSRTLWHAWGGMAPAAAATASTVLNQPRLLEAAVKDSAQFTPQLLAAGGPDNAWSPTPGEAQIAYGVDSRVQGLVATAKAADAPGLLDLAAITAGWFFGANPSGAPAYNPAAGTAIDGIEPDGRVNPNSGAESTIHALLTMLALDANPELKSQGPRHHPHRLDPRAERRRGRIRGHHRQRHRGEARLSLDRGSQHLRRRLRRPEGRSVPEPAAAGRRRTPQHLPDHQPGDCPFRQHQLDRGQRPARQHPERRRRRPGHHRRARHPLPVRAETRAARRGGRRRRHH